jgi:hypothetical protein
MTVGFESVALHLEVAGRKTSHWPPRRRSCAREKGVEKEKRKDSKEGRGAGRGLVPCGACSTSSSPVGTPATGAPLPPPACERRGGERERGLGYGEEQRSGVLFMRSVRTTIRCRSAAINGQRQPAARGPDSAQAGAGRGSFRRPGHWLLGLGPKGTRGDRLGLYFLAGRFSYLGQKNSERTDNFVIILMNFRSLF